MERRRVVFMSGWFLVNGERGTMAVAVGVLALALTGRIANDRLRMQKYVGRMGGN